MSNENLIPVISRYVPGMAVSVALEFADDLQRMTDDAIRAQRQNKLTEEVESAQRVVSATLWAERMFDSSNQDYKIKCIKKLRDKFPGLSLLQAKTIADRIGWSGVGVYLD